MIRIVKRYTRVFRNIRLPWGLLLLILAITVIKSHTEVESLTLTASIIDGTQNAIKTEEFIRYIVFLVLNSLLTISSNAEVYSGTAQWELAKSTWHLCGWSVWAEAESGGSAEAMEQNDAAAHPVL